MERSVGRTGAIRQKALKAVDLAKMEAHGKREDESGKRRKICKEDALVFGGFDLRELRAAWMSDVKQQGNTAALHALVQYPTKLIDGTAVKQQERMLHHAIRFMNKFHGGDAVFAARLDRDERGRHTVDVFMMPRHDFTYKDGRTQKKAAVSKHTKAEAQRRYGKQDRRSQGSALQDAWFEYMRDEMGLDVRPPQRKKATAKDRIEPEEYQLRKEQKKVAAQKARNDRQEAANRKQWETNEKSRKTISASGEAIMKGFDDLQKATADLVAKKSVVDEAERIIAADKALAAARRETRKVDEMKKTQSLLRQISRELER